MLPVMHLKLRVLAFLFGIMCTCLLQPRAWGGDFASSHEARDLETFSPEPALRVEILIAFTRADTFMNLVSETAARVLEVRADVGQRIPDDGIFAVLDATFVRLDIQQIAAERKRLVSSREYYLKEARRYRDLVAGRHADQSTLDKFEHNLEQVVHQLAELEVRTTQLQEKLLRHTVTAPAGFTVIERHVEPGEWVAVGQELASLGDYRTLVAPFALDPLQYQWLQGNKDTLTLRASGGYDRPPLTLPALLKRVSPAFDAVTRKTNVELALQPTGLEPRGGIRVELETRLPDRTGSFLVPASAVLDRYEEHWLAQPDGELVKVVLLGKEPDGRLRVSVPEAHTERRFLLHPEVLENRRPTAEQ